MPTNLILGLGAREGDPPVYSQRARLLLQTGTLRPVPDQGQLNAARSSVRRRDRFEQNAVALVLLQARHA